MESRPLCGEGCVTIQDTPTDPTSMVCVSTHMQVHEVFSVNWQFGDVRNFYMYICMYICIYTYIYTYILLPTSYIYTYRLLPTSVYMHMHEMFSVRSDITFWTTCPYVYTYVISICIYVCIYVYMYICNLYGT